MPGENALRFTADPTTSATLPGHYYYDSEIFAHEVEEIFFKTWQFVGFTFDLQNPGDYITFHIMDEPDVFICSRLKNSGFGSRWTL